MFKEEVIIVVGSFLWLRWILNAITLWKMWKQAPRTFINQMFVTILIFKVFLVPLHIHFMFETLKNHSNLTTFSSLEIIEDCVFYSLITTTIVVTDVTMNIGMFFCRFLYARYAYFLIIDTVKIVHLLVTIVTSTCTILIILIGPLKMMLWNKGEKFFNSQNRAFCTIDLLDLYQTKEYLPQSQNFKFVAPVFVLLGILFKFHCGKAALKMRSRHQIPKRPINYITLEQQNMYFNIMMTSHFTILLVVTVTKKFETYLDTETMFLIWWTLQVIFREVVPFFTELYVFFKIFEKDEYAGYVGRTYPGSDILRP